MQTTLGELAGKNMNTLVNKAFSRENIMAVTLNDSMSADEAAKYLGCSYSYIIHLITKKKLKAQRKGKKWMLDADDLRKAKSTGLVQQRARKGAVTVLKHTMGNVNVKPAKPYTSVDAVPEHMMRVVIDLEKAKYEVLNMILTSKGKNVKAYLNDQIEALYQRIQTAMNATNIEL